MEAALQERQDSIHRTGEAPFAMDCNKDSLAGAVSQRACVFCGSRVVLYPIADALHLVHGPIGCAVYTWDIRGALSSGPELHRLSFSTDLQETDVIFGGEKKLYNALVELIDRHSPKAAFVYSTCIVGIIGDDMAGGVPQGERGKRHPGSARAVGGVQGQQAGRLRGRLQCHAPAGGHGRHQRDLQVQPQHPRRFQPGRGDLADPRILYPHGRRGGGQHHRRRPGGGHPARPRRRAQRGAVLRLHHGSGQDDERGLRHPLAAGLLFRHRGHGRVALCGGRVFQGRGDDAPHPGAGQGGAVPDHAGDS